MQGFVPKLISADVSANYVEAGDILYITLRWQNMGGTPLAQSGKIAVDFLFDRSQRHLENQTDGFRVTWTPFPEFHEWKPGMVLSTTGRWTVPKTWCGTFWMSVSLLGGEGQSLPFVGRQSIPVFREELVDIDMGWGWGHVKLVEQRHPLHVELNPEPVPVSAAAAAFSEPVHLGGWLFDRRYPAVVGADGARHWESYLPVVTVRNRETGELLRCLTEELAPVFTEGVLEGDTLTYAFSGVWGRGKVAFTLLDEVLYLSAQGVEERAPYELISLYFPRLLSVGEQGILVNFFCGGRLTKVADALPMGAEFPYDVCNALAGFDGGQGVAVIADDMESVLYQAVEQIGNTRRGVMGAKLMLKVPAISTEVESIPVPSVPIELHRLEEPSWQALARLMRSRLPDGKRGLYHNTLFYKISADKTFEMDENRPETWSVPMTFPQIKDTLQKMYNITGGMRQVVYLVGWQRGGHDTEYPFPYRYPFSTKLGTAEEWEDCRQFAKDHNILLSFHDNFDDVYQFEGLDPNWLATDSRGRRQKGWLWAGGMSYILSPKAYVLSGEMENRVRRTVEQGT